MSGKRSSQKGSGGEREVIRLIEAELGIRMERNFRQLWEGGVDLVVPYEETGPVANELRKLAIEIKRIKRGSAAQLRNFWSQAVKQAKDKVPCLFWREDQRPWNILVPLCYINPSFAPDHSLNASVSLSLEAWAAVIRTCAQTENGPIAADVFQTQRSIYGKPVRPDPLLDNA